MIHRLIGQSAQRTAHLDRSWQSGMGRGAEVLAPRVRDVLETRSWLREFQSGKLI
ncbi:MAG: hypothetical protein ACKOJF_01385 [Planctomycetaceae bacterium]